MEKLFRLFISFLVHLFSTAEKITYLECQHPQVTYYNPKFLAYANLTAQRYGRNNPVYYVGLNYEPVVNFDHTIYIDVYFYEFLTNRYKRSFIEMHFNWCYLVEKDLFFGAAMRNAGLTKPCPHEPGRYNLQNMTVNPAYIPKGFPFTRGRIYANFSHTKTKVRVAEGHIDIRIATVEKNKGKNFFK